MAHYSRNEASVASRACRRFGKSMAAKMLCAYYDHSCDSRQLFADLEIAHDPSFEEHLNKYPVIYLDITGFTTRYHSDDDIVKYIDAALKEDVAKAYPQVTDKEGYDLMDLLQDINEATGERFVFIIDEWDAICREFTPGSQAMDCYISWLRRMFKDIGGSIVFAGVYMTGILPVKKYKTESALNNFIVYSMVTPRRMAPYFGFTKDMSVIRTKFDVLTVLIHLGYLSYDWRENECYIPNGEVAGEMVNAVRDSHWSLVAQALDKSKKLLRSTLEGDEAAVARGIDIAHDENTSILSYNDENSLACVLSIAYYYARNDYIIRRELASGKGFANLVLIPRKHTVSPAIVIELKYNKDADTAIAQILRKEYPSKVAEYAENLLLVGINYDRDTKEHTCSIIVHRNNQFGSSVQHN